MNEKRKMYIIIVQHIAIQMESFHFMPHRQ